MEGFKNNKDGLDFICEVCGDREGGCHECGWGNKQKRKSKISSKDDITEIQEKNDNFFKEFNEETNK